MGLLSKIKDHVDKTVDAYKSGDIAEGWKLQHTPSKTIFDDRQEKLKQEADQNAKNELSNIDAEFKKLATATNPAAPTSLDGTPPPGNDYVPPPKPAADSTNKIVGMVIAAGVIGFTLWKGGVF